MGDLLRNQIKTILFLSSYTFLFLILIIMNFQNALLTYVLWGIILISNITLVIVIFRCASLADEFIKIKSVENKNSVNPSYLVSYIIPFLSIDYSRTTTIISLLILFVIIGFLYVRSDMIYVNPMLNLFRHNIIEVKTNDEQTLILITKVTDKKEIEKFKFLRLTDNIMVG